MLSRQCLIFPCFWVLSLFRQTDAFCSVPNRQPRFHHSPAFLDEAKPALPALSNSPRGARKPADSACTNPTEPTIKTITRASAVYLLLAANFVVFGMDKILGKTSVRWNLYLHHKRPKFWQLLTNCFCHSDRFHLMNNMFLLLLFGRSVEDDLGWGGLLWSYAFCGIISNVASLLLLSKSTISLGASGAVFGLFAVSTAAKLSSWKDLFDWRKLVELLVLGEFVVRTLASELHTAASGGFAGVNHVAHLSGAAAGAAAIFGMKIIVENFEREEKTRQAKVAKQKKKVAAKKIQAEKEIRKAIRKKANELAKKRKKQEAFIVLA